MHVRGEQIAAPALRGARYSLRAARRRPRRWHRIPTKSMSASGGRRSARSPAPQRTPQASRVRLARDRANARTAAQHRRQMQPARRPSHLRHPQDGAPLPVRGRHREDPAKHQTIRPRDSRARQTSNGRFFRRVRRFRADTTHPRSRARDTRRSVRERRREACGCGRSRGRVYRLSVGFSCVSCAANAGGTASKMEPASSGDINASTRAT